MKFNYIAVDKLGQKRKGSINAVDLLTAKRKLASEKNLYLSKISPASKINLSAGLSIGTVSATEKILFAKHLSAMLKAGVSLGESLEVLSEQSISPKLKRISKKIAKRVREGHQLSSSLARYPKIFDELFINIVRIGEESGTLEDSLSYVVDDLEDRHALRQKVVSASIYPAIVLASAVALGLLLTYFVLPKITNIITAVSVEIPLTTRMLLWISEVMENYGLFIITGFVGAVILFRIIIALKPVKPIWAKFLLTIPIVNKLILGYNLALVNRTMATLLKSGLTIDRAVTVTAATTRNAVYKRRLEKLTQEIQTGTSVNTSIEQIDKHHKLFPLMMVKMISVGEKTGKLDATLSYLSEYYGKEVENTTKNLSSIVEPALLIGIGIVVAFVALSIISPIYEITGQLNR